MKITTSSFGDTITNSIFDEIQELQSNGATSDTYRIKIHGKWHFIKRPKKEFAGNPIYTNAFEREFAIGYTLEHQYIVRYEDKGVDSNGVYLMTEYVDGQTLTEFLKQNTPLSRVQSLKIISQIGEALSYLHNRQIVHFDLKPDNILITNNGRNVKLVDLGFAYSDCFEALSCGSQGYSSPEQLQNANDADLRSDIYAFGKIINEVCKHKYKRVVLKATSQNKKDRYNSVEELLNALNKKSRWWLWMAVPAIIIAVFIVMKSPLFTTITVTNKALHESQKDTLVIQHRDGAVKTKNNSAINQYRTQTKNDYQEAFQELFTLMNNSALSMEEKYKIVDKANATYYKARELDNKRLKVYLAKYPDLEPDFRVINDEEMRVNMNRYNTQYWDILHKDNTQQPTTQKGTKETTEQSQSIRGHVKSYEGIHDSLKLAFKQTISPIIKSKFDKFFAKNSVSAEENYATLCHEFEKVEDDAIAAATTIASKYSKKDKWLAGYMINTIEREMSYGSMKFAKIAPQYYALETRNKERFLARTMMVYNF